MIYTGVTLFFHPETIVFLTTMSLQKKISTPAEPSLPPSILDNITITQLLLDGTHATDLRPERLTETSWLIEDATGREIGLHEVINFIVV